MSGALERGCLLMDVARYADAVKYFAEHVTQHPQDAEGRERLADALRMMGSLDEALQHAEQALREDPERSSAHLTRALILLQMGRPREAEDAARPALGLKPSAWGFWIVGESLYLRLRFDEALEAYHSGLRLEPADYECREGVSRVYLARKDTERLEPLCMELLAEKPGGDTLNVLGRLRVLQGRYDEACELALTRLAEKPEEEEPHELFRDAMSHRFLLYRLLCRVSDCIPPWFCIGAILAWLTFGPLADASGWGWGPVDWVLLSLMVPSMAVCMLDDVTQFSMSRRPRLRALVQGRSWSLLMNIASFPLVFVVSAIAPSAPRTWAVGLCCCLTTWENDWKPCERRILRSVLATALLLVAGWMRWSTCPWTFWLPVYLAQIVLSPVGREVVRWGRHW